MHTYTIHWIDATLRDNYQSFDQFKDDHTQRGIEVKLGFDPGDWKGLEWLDFDAIHHFQAPNDTEAIEYVKQYDFGLRDVEVFTLRGEETGLYYTEENLQEATE